LVALGIEPPTPRGGSRTGFAPPPGLTHRLDNQLAQSLNDLATIAFLGSMKIADKMNLISSGEPPAREPAEAIKDGGG
jgi:hypothetical protein